MSRLPPLVHTVVSLLTILAAFLWLQTASLSNYSLQAFSAAILIYFLVKRANKSRLHHIAPSPETLEMPLMTFALLLLVGSTGNFQSTFFPFTYLHLFFLVLSTQTITAIATTLGIILHYINLSPQMTLSHWESVLTILVLLILFLFTKRQYDELMNIKAQQKNEHRAKKLLEQQHQQQAKEIAKLNKTKEIEETNLLSLESFMQSFLLPKLEHMAEVADQTESPVAIKAQIELLKKRVEELLEQQEL